MSDRDELIAQLSDLVLATKELRRQARRDGQEEYLDDSFRALAAEFSVENVDPPKLQALEAFVETQEKQLERMAVESDLPDEIMAIRIEREAADNGLSQTAQILAKDSIRAAAGGMSEEDWISEVLHGHREDKNAQQGCSEQIQILRSRGPWAWPRN